MPSKQELLDLIRVNADKVQTQEEEREVDWGARREWWRSEVGDLFNRITQLLEPITATGKIRVERTPTRISEQVLGEYETESLSFWLGHKRLLLKPVASVIIGGVGRIDMDGPKGSARLILATPDGANAADYMSNARWHLTAPRRIKPLEEMDDVHSLNYSQTSSALEVSECCSHPTA